MIGKILVTGSKGYIGSHLINNLIKKYEVIGFNRGDNLVLIKDCDVVYHLASNVNMTESVEWENIDNDLQFTINLLKKCVEYNIKSLIFASSGGTIYGPARGSINEQYPTSPICPYGMLKLNIENYIKFYGDLYNINYVILRIANPYGGRTTRGIIYSILGAIKNKSSFIVWGDGSHVRDFIYINDLIEAMILACQDNLYGVFNIGTGKGTSIKKLIEIIQIVTKKELKYIYKPRRFIDSFYNVLDNTKLTRSINWKPQIELIDGINRLVKGEFVL